MSEVATPDAPSVPPTEPVAAPAAPKKRGRGRPPGAKNKPKPTAPSDYRGSDLVPQVDEALRARVAETPSMYWIGALPSCPVGFVTIGGVSFGKFSATLIPDRENDRQLVQHPMLGKIERLRPSQIEGIKARLRKTVVRWRDPEGPPPVTFSGGLQEAFSTPRAGYLITIPTPEEIETSRKEGRPMPTYIPQPNDEPVARYLFMERCADQEHPRAGEYYPRPLEETGIEV